VKALGGMAWQLLALLVVLVVVVITGFVVLSAAGVGTGPYVAFVGGPLVSTIVGAVLLRGQSKIIDDTSQIKTATDGVLAKHFSAIDGRFDTAERQRADNAADQLVDQVPAVLPDIGSLHVVHRAPGPRQP
jgi:hypothetical protein